MKITLIALAALLSMQGVSAAGWSPITKVTAVYPNSDGNIYGNNLANYNPDSCVSAQSVILSTNLAKKEIYAAVLAAKISNSNINFYMSGCLGGTYPIVLNVQVL